MLRGIYSSGSLDVFSEKDVLGFDYIKVDKFVDVVNNGIKCFLRNSVVFVRVELGSKVIV